ADALPRPLAIADDGVRFPGGSAGRVRVAAPCVRGPAARAARVPAPVPWLPDKPVPDAEPDSAGAQASWSSSFPASAAPVSLLVRRRERGRVEPRSACDVLATVDRPGRGPRHRAGGGGTSLVPPGLCLGGA